MSHPTVDFFVKTTSISYGGTKANSKEFLLCYRGKFIVCHFAYAYIASEDQALPCAYANIAGKNQA